MTNATPVLANAIWPAEQSNPWLRNALLAIGGSLLIAISAQIKVPMLPVPMTMQTFAVLLIGLAFGARLGAATVLLYLAEGFAGLPVFTGAAAGGPAYFMGPTGGYLVGFVAAAFAAGWLAEQGWGRPALQVFAAMLIGTAIIYLGGVTWLAFGLGLGVEKAIAAGMVPFLAGDAVKAALAAACLPIAWKLIGR